MAKNVKFLFPSKSKIERPVNDLDKQPGDYDIVSLEDEILELMAKTANVEKNVKTNKPQRFDEEPIMMDIPVQELGVARSIQRPFSISHAVDIAINKWDSRRPLFPQVVINSVTGQKLIIEGNHTSISKGYRAANGKYPDYSSDKWRELPIRCQVVILHPDKNGHVDMSFARDIFIGTNGEDRLDLDDFDIYKNLVLKVRQDYAGNISKCDDNDAKKMYAIQLACESHTMYPVHPRSGRNTTLPGAITHISELMKMSVDGVNFMGKQHKKFWDDLKVDSMELKPMEVLRKLIDKNKSNPDEFHSKEHEHFMYEMAVIQQKFGGSPAGFREFANSVVWPEYYRRKEGSLADDKGAKTPGSNFALVLWLKLHKKAGFVYNCIPNDIYTKFNENGIDCVDCLPNSKQKILKEFV